MNCYFDSNTISELKPKPGDKVKCIASSVKGRTGQVFTISEKDWKNSYGQLLHCAMYGDKYILVSRAKCPSCGIDTSTGKFKCPQPICNFR